MIAFRTRPTEIQSLKLVVLAFIWGVMNHFGLNLIVASLSAIDAQKRGAILGAYSATTYLAASLGTLVFGWAYAAKGYPILLWLASGAAIASLVRCRNSAVSSRKYSK